MARCQPLTPPGDGHGCWHCTGYSTSPDNTYVGMFMVEADYGCKIGCKPCKQAKLPDDYMRFGGLRFLRAHEPIDSVNNNVRYPNRMANGMVGDLRSIGVAIEEQGQQNFWNTRRIPEKIYYHRGVCWANSEPLEGFGEGDVGTDACDCSNRPSTAIPVGSQTCADGTAAGMPVGGNFPDDFFYEDIEVASHVENAFYCRLRSHHDSQVVIVGNEAGELLIPTILRTNVCGGNLIHFCTGEKWCGEPCFDFGDPVPYDCEGHYDRSWQAFNAVPIQFNDVRIRNSSESQLFKLGNDPVIDFKNAVLSGLPTIPGDQGEETFVFGQLDRIGGAIWGRQLTLAEPTVEAIDRSLITFEFGDCRMRQATYADIDPTNPRRHPVSVRVVPYVAEADIKMWLIAQQVLEWPEGRNIPDIFDDLKRIYPHVRMRIRARVSYLAIFDVVASPDFIPENPAIFESWWPEDHPNYNRQTQVYLLNGAASEGNPDSFPDVGKPLRYPPLVSSQENMSEVPYEEALAASPDEILIFDSQGRQFDIPNIVEWWGYMGVYGGQKNYHNPDVEMSDCCRLLRDLDGMKVQGWPYNFGAYDEHIQGGLNMETMQDDDWVGRSLYGGTVQLNFARHANYQAACG